jgi:alkanesulfonate monooxygenase SsuD/methylene tetrahydromethanopterin reductase-like flavin-dependent oxidoreductase (luciferase family)
VSGRVATVRIDLSGFTRGAKRLDHAAVLSFCERIDRLGYDGIWFNEFHFQEPPDPYPSTLLLAAAIFARTTRLRVGTSITILPIHHPLLLAEQVAQLHFQSGGRFDFGIGRGTLASTLAALGIDPETTRSRFESAFELIRAAFSGSVTIAPGRDWPQTSHPAGPLLAEGAEVPIYAAGSTPETVGFAVRHDLPLLLSLEPPEERQLNVYRQVLQGRPATRLRDFSISRYVAIAPTRDAALAFVDDLLPRLYERRLRYARAQNRPLDSIRPIDRAAFLDQQMIAGSPQDCFEQLRTLRQASGIDSIRLVFNCNGEIADDAAETGVTLFGREVLPALQALPPLLFPS